MHEGASPNDRSLINLRPLLTSLLTQNNGVWGVPTTVPCLPGWRVNIRREKKKKKIISAERKISDLSSYEQFSFALFQDYSLHKDGFGRVIARRRGCVSCWSNSEGCVWFIRCPTWSSENAARGAKSETCEGQQQEVMTRLGCREISGRTSSLNFDETSTIIK